ncbi:MAG: hypothetical protein IKZ87_01400 [Actinomycetaceae bacterium]|nr:hypothetical protein [Actinomycetaceae bacterium]
MAYPVEKFAYPVWDSCFQEYRWYTTEIDAPQPGDDEFFCNASDEAEYIANICAIDNERLQHFLKEPFRHVAMWMNYPWQWEDEENLFLQSLVENVKVRLEEECCLLPADD